MNKTILDYFKKENELFSFDKFFENNRDERGIILITDSQIIKTRNILDEKGKKSGHDLTYDLLTKAIYNIIDENSKDYKESKKTIEENRKALNYLQYYQNIMIRMCNEGVNNVKLVWIHLPSFITEKQFEYLKILNNETKKLYEKISKSLDKDKGEYLVGFIDNKNEKITGDSLECVINYITNTNIVIKNDYFINESHIIGDTLDIKEKRL